MNHIERYLMFMLVLLFKNSKHIHLIFISAQYVYVDLVYFSLFPQFIFLINITIDVTIIIIVIDLCYCFRGLSRNVCFFFIFSLYDGNRQKANGTQIDWQEFFFEGKTNKNALVCICVLVDDTVANIIH